MKCECESECENKKSEALAPALTLFVAPSGLELFFQNAYNQLNTEVQFIQVSKNTPLYLHLLLQR